MRRGAVQLQLRGYRVGRRHGTYDQRIGRTSRREALAPTHIARWNDWATASPGTARSLGSQTVMARLPLTTWSDSRCALESNDGPDQPPPPEDPNLKITEYERSQEQEGLCGPKARNI